MTNPTDTPEAPPRWRLEPTLTTDQAPSAFPMPDEDSTACTGDATDEAPPLEAADAGFLLPDVEHPFDDLLPLLDAEKLDGPDDDEPPADSDPADPDGGPARPEPEDDPDGTRFAAGDPLVVNREADTDGA